MLAGRLLVARVIGSVRRSDTHFGVVLTLGIGSLAPGRLYFGALCTINGLFAGDSVPLGLRAMHQIRHEICLLWCFFCRVGALGAVLKPS